MYGKFFVLVLILGVLGYFSEICYAVPNKNSLEGLVESIVLNKTSGKVRVKRYIGRDTIFFTETELQIRERQEHSTSLVLELLPKFGGKEGDIPYANLIQVLTHSRSNVDGPVDETYDHTTGDTISVSVDPVFHKFSIGKWAVYAGSRQRRCLPQLVYGNGHKAVFDCFMDGTYYAFFRVTGTFKHENDVIDGVSYKNPEETRDFFDGELYLNFIIDPTVFYMEYEKQLLQDNTSLTNPWYHSDPITIVKNSYCYRWCYRLIKENEIGFVHLALNPMATGGVYKEYVLKVWIVDPSQVTLDELYSPGHMHPSAYSQVLTKKFALGGLVPCLRFAHAAIDVTADAFYVGTGDVRGISGVHDSRRLFGPYWGFRIKVNYDLVATTLSDISFTITPRQHSALYECFIADVRVTIPSTGHAFLPNAKVGRLAINLNYSWIADVEKRFLEQNVLNYFGHEVVYIGPPYLNNSVPWVTTFSNPCINQELAVSWNGTIGMTWDFCTNQDLNKIVLPTFDKTRLILNPTTLRLSAQEQKKQNERSRNYTYAQDKTLRIGIFDFAYTPVGLIFLINDSSLYLHSPDLALRGIGYNTITQKYKLESLVKRRWCAKTATAKGHNMWVPAFSRDSGHIIIIVQVPLEGASLISTFNPSSSCESIHDPAAKEVTVKPISEAQIHEDEIEDARVDRVVEEKLRTKTAELKLQRRSSGRRIVQHKTLKDVETEFTYWISGTHVLPESDPHFSSRLTDARKVKVSTTELDKFNRNIIFRVESDFSRIRQGIVVIIIQLQRKIGGNFSFLFNSKWFQFFFLSASENFEVNGLSFEMDEIVYGPAGSQFNRSAPNSRMFRFHAVEFTGVEKMYLAAVEFQSVEFPKTVELINSTTVSITTFTAQNVPIVLNGTSGDEVEVTDVTIRFTGTIIRRLQSTKFNQTGQYSLKEEDYLDHLGRQAYPMPMSPLTTTLNPINTAIPIYILRINDVILFASLDGSFAKPLLFYEHAPLPNQGVTPTPLLPFKFFDIIVTEQGIISVLSRKSYVNDVPVTASEAFIGSALAHEPLRFVHPFHVSNNVFQQSTEDGEVFYGKLTYNSDTDSFEGPPQTVMLNVPFWSLLKGSFARSAGENVIPLGETPINRETNTADDESSFADPICPFASFEVYYRSYPYVEAQYMTRITAEVAFYGDSIPLEADILVEFSEIQGVSVVVSSFLEVQYDQTIIRKIIELETFLPDPMLQSMYTEHFRTQDDEDHVAEEVRVFTLTIRPSVLNLHCDKKHYFRTIQMNIGCVPLTRMRLVAEAVPVTKLHVAPWDKSLHSHALKPTMWYHDATDSEATGVSHLVVSKALVHKEQYKVFDCRNPDYCRIPIPAGKRVEDNVYGLSFRDILIPKFEQFLTEHVRRVTSNVVMYDILDSFKEDDFQMEANTTQYDAGCLVSGEDWYSNMAERANFMKELPVYADIYRYFKDCFSRRPSYRQEDVQKILPLVPIQELDSVQFFVFNQTNRNSLRLKKKRNFIYLIRAVVVNTEYNRFTYCQKMDTFFILQVTNIIQQKKVIESYLPFVYLATVAFLVLILLASYTYFARNIVWTVDVEPNRTYEQQEQQKMVEDLQKRYDAPRSPYGRLAQRIAEMEKIQRRAKDYHTSRLEEKEELLGESKRSKSEAAKDKVSRTSQELKRTEAKENLELKETKSKVKDVKEVKQFKDVKAAKDVNDVKETKDVKERKESKTSQKLKAKEIKDVKDTDPTSADFGQAK